MVARPRISVIVPIYKTERTLEMCLDSLVAQTMYDFEVILVNDGSPDKCEDICKSYVEHDGRFRYLYKENGGLSDARNKGLELACGEYVMFLDSDDALSKCALACLLNIADNTEADIVSFKYTMQRDQLNENESAGGETENLICENVLYHYFFDDVSACTRMYKAELLKDIRFVVGQISEDVLFTFKCYQKAKRIYKTDYRLYFYNQFGESITRSGLAVRDNSSVNVNLELLGICRRNYPEFVHLAEQQVYKSMFNIVNKHAIRGYFDEKAEAFYKPLMSEYVKNLRINLRQILAGNKISRNDKIQIFVLSISYRLFLRLKRAYVEKHNT